jgi:hypothetical protein
VKPGEVAVIEGQRKDRSVSVTTTVPIPGTDPVEYYRMTVFADCFDDNAWTPPRVELGGLYLVTRPKLEAFMAAAMQAFAEYEQLFGPEGEQKP